MDRDDTEWDSSFLVEEKGMTAGAWNEVDGCGWMAPGVGAADNEGGGVIDNVLSEMSSVSIAIN